MENQTKSTEEKVIITRDETLYHEQLAKGCGVLGCIIGAIIYFLSGNFNIALIVAICSSIVFIILIMIGKKDKKKPLKINNLTENQEKSERYISKLASETRSFSRTTTEHKILIAMIIFVIVILFGAGYYIFTMNEKLEQRKAERLRLENPQKVFQGKK